MTASYEQESADSSVIREWCWSGYSFNGPQDAPDLYIISSVFLLSVPTVKHWIRLMKRKNIAVLSFIC